MTTDLQQVPNSNSNSNSNNTADNDEIDLLALLWTVLKGWKTILLLALLGLVIGVLYGRYVNPTFQSDALIQIDEKSSGVAALGADISDLVASNASPAQTESELIKSRMVLEPVVNLLNLRVRLSNPEIGFIDRIAASRIHTQINTPEGVALKTENGKAQVSHFDVSQGYLNKSFILTRSESGFTLSDDLDEFQGQFNQPQRFKGTDGYIHITVNDLPEIGETIHVTKQSLKVTTDAINSKLSVVERGKQTGIIQLSMTGPDQQQVSLILKEIILSYIGQNQSRGTEETTKTLSFMETQIPLLRQKLEDSEATFNNFREENGTIDVAQEAQLLLTENANIDAQLNELKLKKADLTTYYTEEHPLVIQINEQLAVLNSRRQKIDTTIGGLPEIQREFLKLSQDTEINREIYLTLLKNYQQLQVAKAGQTGFARIIDLPIDTFNAIAPKKLQIWILALLLGGMLGTMIVLVKNLLRSTVQDPDRLEAKTGIPVIATIPRSPLLSRLGKGKQSSSRLLAYTDSQGTTYEAIKSLRTNLMLAMPSIMGKTGKVILITGESPGVGKSFISSNLSEAFSQLNKKILIIDADMRLGRLHQMFNTTQDNGLGDYLAKDASLVDIIHPTEMENIDFMPRGQHSANPASLLSGDKFANMMTELNKHYDFIIIDTPPILAASDPIIISRYADKILMVIRYDKSIEGQVNYAVKQMNKANIHVDGIILNDVQQGLLSKYNYHYTYSYGNNN